MSNNQREWLLYGSFTVACLLGTGYFFIRVMSVKPKVEEKTPATAPVKQVPENALVVWTGGGGYGSTSGGSKQDTTETDNYERDVSKIKARVLADTINPGSAEFCPSFEVMTNQRGNKVYVGWYTSFDLRGRRGKDNIIAEVDSSGEILKLTIGF
jgi:hypothetical protein